jgi:hypothetical protein
MKNLFSWFVIIVCIGFIVSSCSSTDDTTTTDNTTTTDDTTTTDTTAPTFVTGYPAASDANGTGFTLSIQLDEYGTVYYVVVADNATAPTSEEVKNRTASSGATASASGIISVSIANTTTTGSVTGLSASTQYDLYVTAKDSSNNLMSSPTKVDVTTSVTLVSGCEVVSSCEATPSGSWTLDNGTAQGIYDNMIYYGVLFPSVYTNIDNSTGCMASSTILSSMASTMPTGTAGYKSQYVITGATTLALKLKYYSDSSCANEIALYQVGYDGVTIGDNVTGLNASKISTITLPTVANKVTFAGDSICMKATTTAGNTYLDSTLGSYYDDLPNGTSVSCSGLTYSYSHYWLFAVDNSTGNEIGYSATSTSSYPTDWSSSSYPMYELSE